MQSLKRDIASGFVISAIAVATALAWGSPFVSPRAVNAEGVQPQVVRHQEQSQPAQTASEQTSKAKPHPGTVGEHSQR
jgi:hypothetical protein